MQQQSSIPTSLLLWSTFEGGDILVIFERNLAASKFEISKFFPDHQNRDVSKGIPVVSKSYWLKDPSAPFATFLAIIQTYYHPEARNKNFEELIEMARAGRGGEEMATFKSELERLVRGDREGLRNGAISDATEYDDWNTDEEFLDWLWQELYPGEPVPGTGA
jgi:hypothetical protein